MCTKWVVVKAGRKPFGRSRTCYTGSIAEESRCTRAAPPVMMQTGYWYSEQLHGSVENEAGRKNPVPEFWCHLCNMLGMTKWWEGRKSSGRQVRDQGKWAGLWKAPGGIPVVKEMFCILTVTLSLSWSWPCATEGQDLLTAGPGKRDLGSLYYSL